MELRYPEAPAALARGATSMNRLSLLVDLASLLSREVDLDALLRAACERVAEALGADRATIWLVDGEKNLLVARVALLPELDELRHPIDRGLAGWVAVRGESVRVDDASLDPRFDPSVDRETGYTTKTVVAAPIRERPQGPVRGVVQVLNRKTGAFDEEDSRFLDALALQLGSALALTTLRADSDGPGVVLRGPFNRIVGTSAPMREVYERILKSARTQATVLLRGETGTGKTLLARAIHVNSGRQAGPFVTVDCTTLPSELVESELFGHERGAFTGAERRVLGRVERAHGGTLFLDEIGDLPASLQAKLLRFVQERAFERVGGRETLTADVRVICATHRDLEAEIAARRFREDLYYRIRVVEIDVPPLRDRGSDEVLRLARHFADEYGKRYGRGRMTITAEAERVLASHRWPGNVRELEHWIESAIVLADSDAIEPKHFPRIRAAGSAETQPARSLDDVVREHVARTVAACGGSRTEAAKILGVGRNTVARLLKDAK
jgi:Nif-specific regulatory protein